MDASPGRTPEEARVFAIDRPHPNLLVQYLITAFLTLPAFPIVAIVLYFRYHTLRYRFDREGVSISYGILFRREAFLTYARIQDIHLKRNIIERWLDVATIEIETASGGGSGPETIQGLQAYEEVRDYLYGRMRGAHEPEKAAHDVDETSRTLVEIRDALREARDALKGPA